jgi:hypothetical protein
VVKWSVKWPVMQWRSMKLQHETNSITYIARHLIVVAICRIVVVKRPRRTATNGNVDAVEKMVVMMDGVEIGEMTSTAPDPHGSSLPL